MRFKGVIPQHSPLKASRPPTLTRMCSQNCRQRWPEKSEDKWNWSNGLLARTNISMRTTAGPIAVTEESDRRRPPIPHAVPWNHFSFPQRVALKANDDDEYTQVGWRSAPLWFTQDTFHCLFFLALSHSIDDYCTTSEQTSFEKSTRYHFTRFLLNLWSMVTAFQTHAERPAVRILRRTLNGQHPYA